jgi:hypothetical protein
MAEESSGFLGRWARRKTEVRKGTLPQEPLVPVVAVTPVPVAATPAEVSAEEPMEKRVLSLDDVKLLTQDSDFKPFMARDVGPEVRNAAMKKLFADPHFNVMDGLDTYIDDYSKFDPLPESMLRQMVSAKFLKLFDDEEDQDEPAEAKAPAADGADALSVARESANNPTTETMAQSYETWDIVDPLNSSQPEPLPDSGASQEDHADPHLRLQPDHAAPAPGAGRGTS